MRHQQRSLGIVHFDRRPGEQRHLARPGSRRVHDLRRLDPRFFPAGERAHQHRANPPAVALEADDAAAPHQARAQTARMRHAFQGEAERVDRRVRHLEHRDRALGQRRFQRACRGDLHRARADSGAGTVPREIGDVAFVVTLHGDKVAAGVLYRLHRNALEDLALGAALHRRFTVAGDVAGAAVEQSVIAPRGAGVDIVLLDQDAVDAAQREVAGQRRARDAAADDQDLGLDGRWEIQSCLFSRAWPTALDQELPT